MDTTELHPQDTGTADYHRACADRLAGYARRCFTDGRMVAAERYSALAIAHIDRADAQEN